MLQIKNKNIVPIIYYNNQFYWLDEMLSIHCTSELPVTDSYLLFPFVNFTIRNNNIIDLSFLLCVIQWLQREDLHQETSFIQGCVQLTNELEDNLNKIENVLLHLLRIVDYNSLVTFFERYKDYYNNIFQHVNNNIVHYNEQKLLIDTSIQCDELIRNYFTYDNGKTYIPIKIFPYNFTITGRFKSPLYSHLNIIFPTIIPSNDYVVEIDCVAAEWNYLLYITGEKDVVSGFDKHYYWQQMGELLNIVDNKMTSPQMKSFLYMTIYGAGKSKICETFQLDYNSYMGLHDSLNEHFPKTMKFISSESNQYYSDKNAIIYDFFGKETYVSNNYIKLNYFLQSSLNTDFQLFVSAIREQFILLQLKSKIIVTIHDALYIDIVLSEQKQVFSILRSSNQNNKFILHVKQKKINV